MSPLNVAQISFFLDPQQRRPEQLMRDWWSLVDVAEAASLAGAHVSVIQACAYSDRIEKNGVTYHFLKPDGTESLGQSAEFGRRLREMQSDVLHVHSLGCLSDLRALGRLAPDVPILVQDHADRVPRFWERPAWRRGLSVTSGVAFCALAQAEPFIAADLLPRRVPVFEIPEATSGFTPGDQAEARRLTGVHGDPALLWVGHLNGNKDPLTVLRGVSASRRHLPDLQLWCCFGMAPLLTAVQRCIDADPLLRDRVHLLGRAPHEKIEHLMRAADLFVVGSHHESSGYAMIEALACGLPPVVTDIPSFRALTGGGRIGRLWPCDDAEALAGALVSLARRPGAELRAATRDHFDRELSTAAVGRKLVAAYEELHARRTRRSKHRS